MTKIIIKKKPVYGTWDSVQVSSDFAGKSRFEEYEKMKEWCDTSTEYAVRERCAQLVGKSADGAPFWVARCALLYYAQAQGFKRVGEKPSAAVLRRTELALALNSFALRKESDFFGPEINSTGDNTMKKGKEKKERKISAAAILVKTLALAKVPSNEEIIKDVKAQTGSVKFDESQLAWYKSQFRAGRLKGQNGEPGHEIKQAKAEKVAKPESHKEGKKKVVIIKNRRKK